MNRVTVAMTHAHKIMIVGFVGLALVAGCQAPGRFLSSETSVVCPTCETETRTLPVRDQTYDTHVCTACKTVAPLSEAYPDIAAVLEDDRLDRGSLRRSVPLVHVCDRCESVVGICRQCRREEGKLNE